MFIKILFNYRGERTQGKCVIRANRPDTGQDSHPPFPKLQEKKMYRIIHLLFSV